MSRMQPIFDISTPALFRFEGRIGKSRDFQSLVLAGEYGPPTDAVRESLVGVLAPVVPGTHETADITLLDHDTRCDAGVNLPMSLR